MTSNPGKRIGFYDIARIFRTAYIRAATIDKGVHGFQACGIYPLNPEIFTDADFVGSLMTEEEDP